MPQSELEYVELATKNLDEFFKLYKINHPFKGKE